MQVSSNNSPNSPIRPWRLEVTKPDGQLIAFASTGGAAARKDAIEIIRYMGNENLVYDAQQVGPAPIPPDDQVSDDLIAAVTNWVAGHRILRCKWTVFWKKRKELMPRKGHSRQSRLDQLRHIGWSAEEAERLLDERAELMNKRRLGTLGIAETLPNGEKRRKRVRKDPNVNGRTLPKSEEVKAKISAGVRRNWATNPETREKHARGLARTWAELRRTWRWRREGGWSDAEWARYGAAMR